MLGAFRHRDFVLAAQDPAVLMIGSDALTWATLPGWPTARTDLAAALA